MDPAALTVLLAELKSDCPVAADAAGKTRARIAEAHPRHLEACAYELARLY